MTIKEISNVAIANVAKVETIAKASVKSFGGVDVPSGSIILFEDAFVGTTIDTSKWTLLNTNPSYVSFTQNDELIIGQTQYGTGTTIGDDYLSSQMTFPPASKYYASFDIKATNYTQDSTVGMSPENSAGSVWTPTHRFQRVATNGGTVFNAALHDGTLSINTVENFDIIPDYVTVKVGYDGAGTATWSQWNGSSWTLEKTTTGVNFTADFIFKFMYWSGNATTMTTYIKNVYVCSEDFTTQYPT